MAVLKVNPSQATARIDDDSLKRLVIAGEYTLTQRLEIQLEHVPAEVQLEQQADSVDAADFRDGIYIEGVEGESSSIILCV